MKILKLKKDELQVIQQYSDEVHGMQVILRDLCSRRNEITHKVREIIHEKAKGKVDYVINFNYDGKIQSIQITN